MNNTRDMVTKIYVCPHCQKSETVVRFGFTDGNRQRLRCKECSKTWTPEGPGRQISPEKEALIEKVLQERVSQRAIAHSLGTGRETVRRILKKSLDKVT